jgi:hypothetical protein
MFIAGHTAAGALIGQQVAENPLLGFILGFVSHFLLDLIPHGDRHHVVDYFGQKSMLKKIYNAILVDSVVSVILVAVLMSYTTLNRIGMAWAIIGSVLPDFLVGLNELAKDSRIKWFSKFHFKIHNALIHKIHVKPLPGAIGQVIVIAALLFAL